MLTSYEVETLMRYACLVVEHVHYFNNYVDLRYYYSWRLLTSSNWRWLIGIKTKIADEISRPHELVATVGEAISLFF